MTTPSTPISSRTLAAAIRISFSLPAPKYCEIMMPLPLLRPLEKARNTITMEVQFPTAASAPEET